MDHSAVKALAILQVMNRRPVSFVREISVETGISKPSVVRLLAILAQQGLVQRLDKSGAYIVTELVCGLASGFNEEVAVIRSAQRKLDEATANLMWPLAIGTYENGAMVVRYSTIGQSRVAWYRATFGARLSLRNSGMGQAYLSALTAQQCESVLVGEGPNDTFGGPEGDAIGECLSEKLAAVRTRGYAVRAPSPGHSTTSVSVPIIFRGNPVGAVSITVYAKVMSAEDAGLRYHKDIEALAEAIAKDLAVLS